MQMETYTDFLKWQDDLNPVYCDECGRRLGYKEDYTTTQYDENYCEDCEHMLRDSLSKYELIEIGL